MQEIIQVDAFTKTPFCGNPAAVCLMKNAADDTWMQQVALEMNLSETAFLYPDRDGYNLRWFTPGAEVQLCGHATLASAHVLFEDGHVRPDAEIEFYTKFSGTLKVKRDGQRLLMDFPVLRLSETAIPAGFGEATGLDAVAAAETQGKGKLVVEVSSADALRRATPDFAYFGKLDYWGVCLTACAGDGHDFISRYFAPRIRINEDPATGSAQCALIDYWSKKLNKSEFHTLQASQRGGEFHLKLENDRCLIGGDAVITMRGQLII